MTATLLFLTAIAAIVGWWLSQQRLASKPWLETGLPYGASGPGKQPRPAGQIGLGVLLVVIGALFALLLDAQVMRVPSAGQDLAGAMLAPVRRILWLNTVMLVLCSASLEWSRAAARRGWRARVFDGLAAGGACSLAFLAGQCVAWRELAAAGAFAMADPATAFFFLLTGLHGLHVVGGVAALGRTIARAWREPAEHTLRQGVGLLAAYWHFLLLVWLVVFARLAGWADDLPAICRALVAPGSW